MSLSRKFLAVAASAAMLAAQAAAQDITVAGGDTLERPDPETVVGENIDVNLGAGSVLVWGGAVTVSAGAVTLDGETTHFGDAFTLKALNLSAVTLEIGLNGAPVETLTFGMARNTELALFDFSEGGAGSGMQVADGTVIGARLDRQITGFTDDYLIAKGLSAADAQAVADNLDFRSGSQYITGSNPYADGGEVRAEVRFSSPFDYSGENALSARDSLHGILNGPRAAVISDAQYAAILGNARSAHPEGFMEQAGVFVGGIDALTRTARQFGLRGPQRARITREGGAYRLGGGEVVEAPQGYAAGYDGADAALSADAYGGTAETEYQGTASAASAYAYPQLIDCLADCFTTQGLRMWGGYVGDWSDVDASGGHNGYEASTHGFVLGLTRDFGTFASVGVYGGYTANTTTSKLANSEVTADAGHLGIQARISPVETMQALSVYADLGYHWSDNDMRRTLGGWDAEGNFSQSGLSYGIGVEHVFDVNGINIAPYLDLRHIEIDQDGMRERGNSVTAAGISGFDRSGLNTRLGAQFSREFLLTNGAALSPAANIAWKHEYGDRSVRSSASYIGGNGSDAFAMTSSTSRQDSVDLGVSLRMEKELAGSGTFGANIAYNMNIARGESAHTLQLGAEIGF